jgi:hypothetical protein
MIPLRSRSDSFPFTPGLSAIVSESNFSRCPKDISARETFGGRLETFGVREHVEAETPEATRFLTDGRNYLVVDVNPEGDVMYLTRRGGNGSSRSGS